MCCVPICGLNVHYIVCVTSQVSAIESERIEIDQDTKELLDSLDFKDIPNLYVPSVAQRAA